MFRYRTALAAASLAATGAARSYAVAHAEEEQASQTQTAWTRHTATYWYNSQTGESTWVEPEAASIKPSNNAVTGLASGAKWDKHWDKVEQGEGEGGKAVHHIVLIRHGQYCAGTDDDVDRLLTEKGISQSLGTGKRLKELVDSGRVAPIKYFFNSTMIRASQTADLILTALPPITAPGQVRPCSMIREGACMVPEPAISKTNWDVSETDFHRDGIRIEAAFRSHIHRAGKDEKNSYTTVLVCHGNVIRYLTMRALQLDPAAWLRLSVANGSMTILSVYPTGKVSLSVLGDVGHLPTDLITYN